MKCTLSLLLCLQACILFSQSSDHYIIATQGGFSKGESMSLSWTIGDFVTESTVQNEAITTQGFQQPALLVKELVDPNQPDVVITQRNSVDFSAEVYPNPVGADITINVENSKQEYFLDLFDPSGTLLLRSRSSSPQAIMNLRDLPVAQYILRVSLIESVQSKTFLIITAR